MMLYSAVGGCLLAVEIAILIHVSEHFTSAAILFHRGDCNRHGDFLF